MDSKAIFKSIWPAFMVWLVMVATVGVSKHQPGIVCATPLAWLLSLWVGLRCANITESRTRLIRLSESAIAGGTLGLLQGVLFLTVAPMMGPVEPSERTKMIALDVIIVGVGSVICGILSVAIAASQERRRTK